MTDLKSPVQTEPPHYPYGDSSYGDGYSGDGDGNGVHGHGYGYGYGYSNGYSNGDGWVITPSHLVREYRSTL